MDGLVLLSVIKDLSIILFMVIGIFVMTLFTIFSLIMYRKLSESMDSVQSTLKSTEETARLVTNNWINPVVNGSILSFVVNRIFKKVFNRSQDKEE
ncbi:hypothetical protein M1N14_01710 [Dehalococcoidia bacterium]|nr:hypothetical protein [Dehalococcoidia bacterium]